MHLVGYSLYLELIDLQGLNSIENIIHKCRDEINFKNIERGGKWIRGRGWNQDYFQGGEKKISQ